MSLFFDIAEELKADLAEVVCADDMEIIINKQADVRSQFNTFIKQVKGAVGIIEFIGAKNRNLSSNGKELSLDANYFLSLWAKPTLRKGKEPIDDILELCAETIHGWAGTETFHCTQKAKVTDIKQEPDDTFTMYVIYFTKPIYLNTP